jgi:hypothetical protein
MRIEDQILDDRLLTELDADQIWIIRGGANPVCASEGSLRKVLPLAKQLEDKGQAITSVRDLRDRTIRPARMRRLFARVIPTDAEIAQTTGAVAY